MLTGAKAKAHLIKLQGESGEQRHQAAAKKAHGYFKNAHVWTAFDDRTGDCWVEEFPNEQGAIDWLNVAPVDMEWD